MTAMEIMAIVQLVAALEPAAVALTNNLVTAFSSMPLEERSKALDELAAALKPMVIKA